MTLLFGGIGPTLRKAEFRQADRRPLWVRLLEQAFVQITSTVEGRQLYGDPDKGGTIEQAWRTYGLLTGKSPVCLLATGRPPVETGAIEKLVKMDPHQLISTLSKIFALSDRVGPVLNYWDGRIGHTIALFGYDKSTSRFLYHDTWPGRSLLCKENNAADVDAKHEDKYWSVTSAELERVVFSCFILQACWAELNGEKYYSTFEDLKSSDFWSFFNLAELGAPSEGERETTVSLEPGGFQSEINLTVTLTKKNRISAGFLALRRTWATGPPFGINPFASDIARNFILTIVPPPDRKTVGELVRMFDVRELAKLADEIRRNPSSFSERAIDNENPSDDPRLTYLGLSNEYVRPFEFSNVSLSKRTLSGVEWLEIRVDNDVL